MKVFLQGHGEVSLSQNDFVATGGQASVYVKGGMAYKIYTDAKDAIPPEKFHALAAIGDPAVVKPTALLLNARGSRIGYAMDAVTAPHSLCQLFTQAFRDRHKVDGKHLPLIASALRRHVLAVHQAGIVVVDLNELNVLVPDTFDETFLIDVDSYQTPQFPATVIMPSVRDWSCPRFGETSDWYSYAILAFQLFIGCHPFKGRLDHPELASVPKDERMEWRMRRHFSAFRKEASLPPCCPSFDVIPGVLRAWLAAVLDDGKRMPPPDLQSLPAVATALRALRSLSSAGELALELVKNQGQFIAAYDRNLFLLRTNGVPTVVRDLDGSTPTTRSPDWTGEWMKDLGTGQTAIGFTPKMQRPVAFRLQGGVLTFYDFEHRAAEAQPWAADEISTSGDRFYVRSGSGVHEIAFLEPASNRTVAMMSQKVADVLPRASRLFEGCVVQSLLGAVFVSLFPKAHAGYQVRIRELDGAKVLDAKFLACKAGGVLGVLAARAGKYERLVFRFDEQYDVYDTRVVSDVEPNLLNFVVLPEAGITAWLVEDDALEVFIAVKGKTAVVRKIQSALLGTDLRLCRVGDGIGFTRGSELYRLRLGAPS